MISAPAARIRIGRVRMKNGGADVRVLHRAPEGRIEHRIRDLANHVSQSGEASAFVGITFWRDDKEPWRPEFAVAWDTIDPNLPLPRLMRVAAAEIEGYGAAIKAEDKVMRALGYQRGDDPEAS
jgi:hypothetical protein